MIFDQVVFEGEIPRVSPRLLPENHAASAMNCDLSSGNIRPEKGLTVIQDLTGGATAIYLLGDRWLQWESDVDVIESPVYNSDGRIFFTGDGYPKATDASLAIGGTSPYPTTTRRLGIAAPDTAPSYTITSAGSGTDRDIAYCYTRVGRWEDGTDTESAPSPPTDVFVAKDDATVKVFEFVDDTSDGAYTTHYRIYRINQGLAGAEFQYVDEIEKTVSPLEYSDSVSDDDLGEVLPTTNWDAPPDDLQGMISGSNGLIYAFREKKLYVSEPFIGYAFPEANTILVESEIVGIGAMQAGVVVVTKTCPYILRGSDPSSLSLEKISHELPGISKQSIVGLAGGVIYASPFGLILLESGGGVSYLTKNLFTREQWETLAANPVIAFFFDNAYLVFFRGTDIGIQFTSGDGDIIRFRTGRAVFGGRYVSTVAVYTYNLLDSGGDQVVTSGGYDFYAKGDEESIIHDTLYLIQSKSGGGRQIVSWQTGDDIDATYLSGKKLAPGNVAITAGRVIGDFSAGDVVFSLYVDDTLSFTKTVSSSDPFRITPKRGEVFQVEVVGKATVNRVIVGTSLHDISGAA
jgi:hypothetical protein